MTDRDEGIGGAHQCLGMSPWRKRHDDPFIRTQLLHSGKHWTQISVTGNQDRSVVDILRRVLDHPYGNVDIRLLLLVHNPPSSAAPTPARPLLESPLCYANQRTVICQGIKVGGLPGAP